MERLKDCIEELLKFTLSSHIDETLDFDLGISKQFCSNLLQDDPNNAVSPSTSFDFDEDSLQGVPLYPLYKRLALALCRSVNCGAFYRTYKKVALMNEDCFLEQKEEDWNQLILNKGSELVNILKAVEFEIHVQEPFFSLIKDGLKTVEGRCAVDDYNRIEPGSVILLNKCVMLKVQCVHHYDSFSEMLKAESVVKVLPGVKTIDEGVQIYRKFYTEEKERFNGVLAICVSKLATQPYITLASLLSALSYGVFKAFLVLLILLEQFQMHSHLQDQLFYHHSCCLLSQISLDFLSHTWKMVTQRDGSIELTIDIFPICFLHLYCSQSLGPQGKND